MSNETPSDRLKRSGYDSILKARVAPLLRKVEENSLEQFEKEFCHLASEVLQEVETGKLSATAAQDLFMLLDVCVTDTGVKDRLTKEARDLLFEGLLFHDLGTPHGPNFDFMRQVIQARLRGKGKGNKGNKGRF